MAALVELAPAKVNLTLSVLGRRADGYHLLDSLVVFAGLADRLAFTPGSSLSLTVRGETAEQAGPLDDNLVLKAAAALDPSRIDPRESASSALPSFIEEIERKAIEQALTDNRYNKTKAAAQLGITFRALRYKLKKLGID